MEFFLKITHNFGPSVISSMVYNGKCQGNLKSQNLNKQIDVAVFESAMLWWPWKIPWSSASTKG